MKIKDRQQTQFILWSTINKYIKYNEEQNINLISIQNHSNSIISHSQLIYVMSTDCLSTRYYVHCNLY